MAKSVESYGPKLMAALLQAADKGIDLTCPTKAKATALRHRLYSLRVAMRKENHPDVPAVARLSFSIVEMDDGWHLVGQAADTTFDDILEGIKEPKAPEIDL